MFLYCGTSEIKSDYFLWLKLPNLTIFSIAGNLYPISYTDLECTLQSLHSSYVIDSSHLCAFCMVLNCWCYMEFENCCFKLNHPSHFVNVNMFTIATCCWSLCVPSVTWFVRIIYRAWTLETSDFYFFLSLNKLLTVLGSQSLHICYLNS